MVLADTRILDSITQVHAGEHTVIIAASHGAEYAGYLGARLGARGLIFNDAGVGKDAAGISALPALEECGIAGATVDHDTARIGDGFDCAERGVISAVNATATACGCEVGQSAMACARAMHDADEPESSLGPTDQQVVLLDDGAVPVWGMDSLSLVEEEHAGTIVITGSHGERLAGERTGETYLPTPVAGATFFDAGPGIDGAGIGRLEVLDDRGIPAATINVDTAHIGDAQSAWETGRLSHINDEAIERGVRVGDDCRAFAVAVRAHL